MPIVCGIHPVLEALAAGYATVSICSCTEHKQPANYHWPNDLAENVDFGTVNQAIDLAEAMTRSLSGQWVTPAWLRAWGGFFR